MSETPLRLDQAALLARVDGNQQVLADLAGVFVEDGPERLAALRQAVASADPAAVWLTAHHLQGALGLFGRTAAVEAARELENMGRCGELFRAGGVFARLEAETQRLLAALTSVRREEAT